MASITIVSQAFLEFRCSEDALGMRFFQTSTGRMTLNKHKYGRSSDS